MFCTDWGIDHPDAIHPAGSDSRETWALVGLARDANTRRRFLRLGIGPDLFTDRRVQWIGRAVLTGAIERAAWCSSCGNALAAALETIECGTVGKRLARRALLLLLRDRARPVLRDTLQWAAQATDRGVGLQDVRRAIEQAFDLFTPTTAGRAA